MDLHVTFPAAPSAAAALEITAASYSLVAVGIKFGGAGSGHWTGAVRHGASWSYCDDDTVTPIPSIAAWLGEELALTRGTMFYYERM